MPLFATNISKIALINPKGKITFDTFYYIDLESICGYKINKITIVDKINAPSRAQRVLKKGDLLYSCVRPYQNNNAIFFLRIFISP